MYLLTFTGSAFSLNKGDGLILLCAVAFALQIAYTGRYAPRYPALPLAALQLGFVGLLSIAASCLWTEAARCCIAESCSASRRCSLLC